MTKTEAYRRVALNLLLELTEDGNDMTWPELNKEVDRLAKLQQEVAKLEKKREIDFL